MTRQSKAGRLTCEQIALVHVAKRQLGLRDDEYRALLWRTTGALSAAELDQGGFNVLLKAFEELGFRSTSQRRPFGERPGFATDAQVGLIRRLWCEFSTTGTEQGLATWLENKFGVSALRFLPFETAPGVITALKSMVAHKREKQADPAS